MFDEIFNRWILTGQLYQSDIIPLFIEWNQTFGDGKGKLEEVEVLMTFIHADYFKIMENILKNLGVKKGYNWEELRDAKTGRLYNRFFVK